MRKKFNSVNVQRWTILVAFAVCLFLADFYKRVLLIYFNMIAVIINIKMKLEFIYKLLQNFWMDASETWHGVLM